MNSLDQFKKNLNILINNYNILKKYRITPINLNLGGGFPESTIMPQDRLRKIAKLIKRMLLNSEIKYENIYIEPGRYFVGDSGFFITKIVTIKEDRWIFLNIGNHICPKFARCSLRFYNATLIDEPHKYKTSIAGILPTDQDVLGKNYFFTEKLKKGDKVLVLNTGAYCLTFSNRFPYILPRILLIKDSSIREIFNPETDIDFSIN